MKGDNVTKQYYGRRLDGMDLYRYAVPNVRTEPKPMGELIAEDEEKYWTNPQFMILQRPTEREYGCAIDVESAEYTYTETDIPIDVEPSPIDEDIVQKAEAFDYLTGRSDGDE